MKRGVWLLIFLLLTSCAVGPNYLAPKTKLSKYNWSTRSNQLANDALEHKWWENLKDPQLSKYVEAIATDNLDVAIACKRLMQARSMQQIAHARSGPHIWANASITNEQISKNGRILGLFPQNPLFQNIPLNRKVYQPGFDANWEIDVFGQNYRLNQQRAAQTAMASLTVDDTVRQLRAELARAYVLLRATQKKISITKRNVKLQPHLTHKAILTGHIF